jgi:hypothetical protein
MKAWRPETGIMPFFVLYAKLETITAVFETAHYRQASLFEGTLYFEGGVE